MTYHIEIKPGREAVSEITVREGGQYGRLALALSVSYSKRGLLELQLFEFSPIPGMAGHRLEGQRVLPELALLLGYEPWVPGTLVERSAEYAAACDLFRQLSTQPPAMVAA